MNNDTGPSEGVQLPTTGYVTLQFARGGLFDAVPLQVVHLVRSTERGTPGPTLCQLDRFDKTAPGWSVGGGVSDPNAEACRLCIENADRALPIVGRFRDLFRIALAYGFNPLTGRQTPRWRVRNVRAWVRTSPPVGALFDSFRSATSYMVVACQGRRRWFDLDAVRKPSDYHRDRSYEDAKGSAPGQRPNKTLHTTNPAGAPPLDWFMHNPKGFAGAHFATWDPEMLVESIEAMCPRKVCTVCGEPSWRITRRRSASLNTRKSRAYVEDARQVGSVVSTDVPDATEFTSIGWSCCGHGAECVATVETGVPEVGWRWAVGPWGSKKKGIVQPGTCDDSHWRRGVVLDPFAGTGSTLAAALSCGRDSVGIELDKRNVALAEQRVGMFLEVEFHAPRSELTEVQTPTYRACDEPFCSECGDEGCPACSPADGSQDGELTLKFRLRPLVVDVGGGEWL